MNLEDCRNIVKIYISEIYVNYTIYVKYKQNKMWYDCQ